MPAPGKPFHVSNVYRILTSTAYTGVPYFNRRDSRSEEDKPATEWIALSVPGSSPPTKSNWSKAV
jgi:hypothetical protein